MASAVGKSTVFTIGHSSHEFVRFAGLLKRHFVDAVVDVRSVPYSRRYSQFNRNKLEMALKSQGIDYLFMGAELGARSQDPSCYKEGRVQYRKLAGTSRFHSGIQRVLDESCRMRVALMCAEKDPLNCHRTILVARELVDRGIDVQHILASGKLESHEAALQRLMTQLNLPEQDLFESAESMLDRAYAIQESRIAYSVHDHT